MTWEEYARWLEQKLSIAEQKIEKLTSAMYPVGITSLFKACGLMSSEEQIGSMKFHNDCSVKGLDLTPSPTFDEYLDGIDISRELDMLRENDPRVKVLKHNWNEYLHNKLEEFNRRQMEEES